MCVFEDVNKIQKQIASLQKSSGRSKDTEDGNATSRNTTAEQIEAASFSTKSHSKCNLLFFLC